MTLHTYLCPLDFLATIRVAGPDARTFLQGQLSSDVGDLNTGICQLASCNSPQGRVQAILTLVSVDDGYLLVLPAAMVKGTLERLRKYVLRSKVALTEPGQELVVHAADHAALASAGLPCPEQPGQYLQHAGMGILRWHQPGPDASERFLALGTPVAVPASDEGASAEAQWRLAEIRSGLPQVLPETRESFVAQMLNLDLLGGISFSKGCYTGQEIIARTQYRGAIKRRMFRFSAACSPPSPGTRVLQGEVHAGDVVDAAATPEGCELLAVVTLAQKDAELTLAAAPGAQLRRLSLPYQIAEG